MTMILTPEIVVRMLLALPGVTLPQAEPLAEPISIAANANPVEEGAEILSASMLVAIAWHESRLNAKAIGDHGRSFGLFQVQAAVWKVEKEILFIPSKAAPVAMGLLKRSYQICIRRPWDERIAWYAASGNGCPTHPKIVEQSKERMRTASKVFGAAVFDSTEEHIPWAR